MLEHEHQKIKNLPGAHAPYVVFGDNGDGGGWARSSPLGIKLIVWWHVDMVGDGSDAIRWCRSLINNKKKREKKETT